MKLSSWRYFIIVFLVIWIIIYWLYTWKHWNVFSLSYNQRSEKKTMAEVKLGTPLLLQELSINVNCVCQNFLPNQKKEPSLTSYAFKLLDNRNYLGQIASKSWPPYLDHWLMKGPFHTFGWLFSFRQACNCKNWQRMLLF